MNRAAHIGTVRHEDTARRLRVFFVASLCVHAGLLAVFARKPALAPADHGQMTLSMTVAIAGPRAAETHRHSPRAVTSRRASPRARHVVRRRLAARHDQPSAVKPAAETSRLSAKAVSVAAATAIKAVPPARPATGAAADSAATVQSTATAGRAALAAESARTRVRALLLTDFARRFTYPRLARRRGWQGRVLLTVTVKPDGALDRVQVAQSSGYDILDRSAVRTARRIGRLVEAGPWLRGRALELLLPVVYRLTD